MCFNENNFINNIIKNCDTTNIDDINNNFDKNFDEIISINNIDNIFDIYCQNDEDIEDAKLRYGKKYKELKLNLILYNILLRYLRII